MQKHRLNGCADQVQLPVFVGCAGIHIQFIRDPISCDCILEDFGRRGPEVQSAMRVILRRCLIRNWGEPGRFDVRAFAAWAHHGGRIEAESCVFDQPRFWRGWRVMALDWLAHLGQAWNDEGLRGLLRPANWLPGVCRGLTATAGGHVRAADCRATRWWIRLEGHHGPRMSREDAQALRRELAARLPRSPRSM